MRKKPLILVAFLLMLYIAPMIFISSYASPCVHTEPNMNKDFVISADWYNSSWLYRKEITILIGSGIAGTDYQVLVEVAYESNMQADFGDIIFVDDDHDTLFDFWLETANATWGIFWVEVADYMDSNNPTTIYMYYGNSTVSTASDGEATFLMFEDWASESVRGAVWDILTPDGSVSYSGVDANHGKTAKFDANAEATYRITSDYDTASPIAVMFRSNIEEADTVGNVARQGSGYDGAFAFNLVHTRETDDEKFFVYDDDGNQDSQVMTTAYFDTWVTFQITRDGTNSKLYADTILIETASCAPDIVATNPAASIMLTDSEDVLYSDWVAVRKFIPSEPYVDSFGAEDPLYPPEWELVDTAELIFSVPVFTGSLDALLIFAGLIMIPASTLYLVKGGKSEMSNDKLFYGLIAFVMGWALFLGGIFG